MGRIIDLYNQTPEGMIFLFVVFYLVYGYLLHTIYRIYWRRAFKNYAETMAEQYKECLEKQRRRRDFHA